MVIFKDGDLNLSDSDRALYREKTVEVVPGAATVPHNHHDVELWGVLEGEGRLTTSQTSVELSAGDWVFLSPLETHQMVNTSTTSRLVFKTVWWEEMAYFDQQLNRLLDGHFSKPPSPTNFVLPSFPTPNGDLHVGHLSGPYVGGDIFARYLRLRGAEARLVLGTVGHQSHVAAKGIQLGLGFYETAEKYSGEIVDTLSAVSIYPSVFIRPTTSKYYRTTAQDVFRVLYAAGTIVVEPDDVWYCDTCEKFLFEAFVSGTCAYCGYEDALGNECEKCGRFYRDRTLQSPRCNTCEAIPILRKLMRPLLVLEKFRAVLDDYHRHVDMPPKLRAFCREVMADPLPNIPVSYITEVGIEVPAPGLEDQRLFSAFELAPRFLAALRELADMEQRPWPAMASQQNANTVLFFGFDNAYLRAIIFPVVLHAYDSSIDLPRAMVVNEFYLLDDKKFSTSRNHAIWGRELASQYPADAIRFYLAYTRPEFERTNFHLDEFHEFVDHVLIREWDSCIRMVKAQAFDQFDGRVPEAGTWDARAAVFYSRISATWAHAKASYEPGIFSTRRVTRLLNELVRETTEFCAETATEFGQVANPSIHRTYMSLALMALQSIGLLVAPIMPTFAENLWSDLGHRSNLWEYGYPDSPQWVPPGTTLSLGNGYFQFKAIKA